MENAGTILSISMFVTIFASWITGSYRAGLIGFSAQSALRGPHRKFQVDTSRIKIFTGVIVVAFLANLLYALLITSGDFGASALFSLINTLFMSYALAYWLLLTQKNKSN